MVGLYVRRTVRKRKDDAEVAYLALAHNERVNGTSSTRVLLNFGREDQLDPDALRRLVSSLTRYLGDPAPYADDPDADPSAVGLSVTESKSVGGVWLLDALWHQLGIDAALGKVLGGPRASPGRPPQDGNRRLKTSESLSKELDTAQTPRSHSVGRGRNALQRNPGPQDSGHSGRSFGAVCLSLRLNPRAVIRRPS